MKRRLSVTNFSSKNNLPTFQLNAPVVIRAKERRCEQTLLFIAMHYWGYTSLEVKGRWGLLLPASSSQWSNNQGLPVLYPGWSAPLWMSSEWRTGCPWLLDRCDEEAGREEQSSPTFDLQWRVSSVVHGNVCLHLFTFALMMIGALNHNVGKLFAELKLVTDNPLFIQPYLCMTF